MIHIQCKTRGLPAKRGPSNKIADIRNMSLYVIMLGLGFSGQNLAEKKNPEVRRGVRSGNARHSKIRHYYGVIKSW